MSAVTVTPALDVSGTPPVPFARLVSVELRKMYDTRAGLWLLVAIGLITAAIVVIFSFAASEDEHTFLNFMGVTATPQGFLLPVLGILLVTQEWGQRTALTTFALEPSRSRVIVAKVVAALVLGLLVIVVAVAVATLATLVTGSDDAWTGIGVDDFAKFGLLQLSGILGGLAFGLILLNSAAAIVTSFVLPIAFTIVANLWGWLRERAAWVDISTAQQPLFSGVDVTDKQWAQLAAASAIWIVLPFLAGLWRVLRAELK